jgi:hypothetical protein
VRRRKGGSVTLAHKRMLLVLGFLASLNLAIWAGRTLLG